MKSLGQIASWTVILLGIIWIMSLGMIAAITYNTLRINSVLQNATPADVLDEVRLAREEFNSSRFTHADGVRMNQRIDNILHQNNLKESSE